MVGVVSHFQFATPDNRKYKAYIKYMSRDEAKRTEVYREETNFAFDDVAVKDYDAYNSYMSNPEKTSGLFNQTFNQMPHEAVKALKKQFQLAQKRESNMWQIVVSFDNDWLKKFGAYDPERHVLDESLVMNAARNGMKEVLKAAHMEQAVWSGAIHYNTDNIHIHLAIVEPIPSKPKRWYQDKTTGNWQEARPGYLPYRAIDQLKSQVANTIAGRVQEHIKLDTLIRSQLGNREDFKEHLRSSFQLQNLYKQLYQVLPEDKRLWKYNNQAMNAYRAQIDVISQLYIDRFQPKAFQELKEKLALETDFIKETYGDGVKSKRRYQDYERVKLRELYAQLGNTILKDLAQYDKQLKGQNTQNSLTRTAYSQSPRVNLYALKQSFYKTREELLRQREFEALQREMGREL